MSYRLVISEKPSVAMAYANVLGATNRKDGYLEGGGWRVSWCVGHLAGLADADAYNPDYAKWRYDDLPILPEPWQMVVSKDKKKPFDVLKQLMNAPALEQKEKPFTGKDHSISFENIRFAYKEDEVLHGVSLTVPEGSLTAVSYTHLTLPTTSRV